MVQDKIVRVGVGCWVVNPLGQVLFGKRLSAHGNGTWAPPGGHLEFGETPDGCAARELMEETGIQILPSDFRIVSFTNDIFPNKHYITIHCVTSGVVATPKLIEPDKCEEWRWFYLDKLPENLFLPAANFLKQKKL